MFWRNWFCFHYKVIGILFQMGSLSEPVSNLGCAENPTENETLDSIKGSGFYD
jgi:hypothetical protein